MTLLLIIRYVLSTENKRRDREQLDDGYDDVYIERMGKDGKIERIKVDKVKSLLFFFFMFTDVMRILAYILLERLLGIPGSYRYPES